LSEKSPSQDLADQWIVLRRLRQMPSRSSMVRVTLTNHRRLCLFPADYAIRHTVVTVKTQRMCLWAC